MKRIVSCQWIVLFSALILVSSCGQDDPTKQSNTPVTTDRGSLQGDAVTATVGTSGGSLESADGRLTVTIPSGALSANTLISIQPISNEGPLGIGNGYRLQPEGTTFAQPVTLSFHYDDDLLEDTPEDFLWIITQAGNGSWNAMLKSELNRTNKTVEVTTTHFSDWALGKFIELALTPSSKTILKGESVDLHVMGFQVDDGIDELAPLVAIVDDGSDYLAPLTPIPPTESRLTQFRVKGWTLNGTAAPVTNSNGSLTATKWSGKYTAPKSKPTTNPVAVTVALEAKDGDGKNSSFLLTSNITVVESNLYLIVDIDGQTFEYDQYGFNGTSPSDDSNYAIANCGIDGNTLSFAGSELVNENLASTFALTIEGPAKGSKTLVCSYDDGNDDAIFSYGQNATYVTNYVTRKKVNNTCESESRCASFTVTFTKYVNEREGDVQGSFDGLVYEDFPDSGNSCKSMEPHKISGKFSLKRAN